jgi:hypothetical protein
MVVVEGLEATASLASISARPQEQFLQAFFFVSHPEGSNYRRRIKMR